MMKTLAAALAGSPDAIRASFYPGESFGQEFAYPKKRALELAAMSKVAVPALAVDVTDPADFKTVRIVAVTPEFLVGLWSVAVAFALLVFGKRAAPVTA